MNNSNVIRISLKHYEYFHTNSIETKHIYTCIVYLIQILLNTRTVIAQIVLRKVLNTKVYINCNLIQHNMHYSNCIYECCYEKWYNNFKKIMPCYATSFLMYSVSWKRLQCVAPLYSTTNINKLIGQLLIHLKIFFKFSSTSIALNPLKIIELNLSGVVKSNFEYSHVIIYYCIFIVCYTIVHYHLNSNKLYDKNIILQFASTVVLTFWVKMSLKYVFEKNGF